MARKFNPLTPPFDYYEDTDAVIPQNTVEVLTGCTEVAGKRYASVANAITYINTQTPSSTNLWSIASLNKTNAEDFTLPNGVGLHSPKGFQGITQTIFTGSITWGEYSVLNSVKTTGQVTVGSTNASLPSIAFGSYIMGTLVIPAGTYFQPVNSLLQVSANLELNGQMQMIGGTWISSNISVNTGGVLAGYINMFGGIVVDNGGTIQINPYGPLYDNATSGLTADTVGDAIDELENEIDAVITSIPADTDDLPEGSTNLYYTEARFNTSFAAKDTDDLSEGSTNLYDKTVALTEGTNVTITGTYPNFTINASDNSLWQKTAGIAELKVEASVDLKADNYLIY